MYQHDRSLHPGVMHGASPPAGVPPAIRTDHAGVAGSGRATARPPDAECQEPAVESGPLMITYNTAIVLIGTSLLGANAGLVGSFAVLRRRALTGDALAHAALPGLCLAFLLVGQRSLPALLLARSATGVLGVVTVAALRRWTRIKEDAAIGIVLSVFFGAGIS